MTQSNKNELIEMLQKKLEVCDAGEKSELQEKLSALLADQTTDRTARMQLEAEHDIEVEAMFDNMPV